jgi:glycosyltransferase involved in cell wall biosynthesis
VADSEWGEDHPVQLRAPIRVLFVGKYESEHGVDLLLGTLKLLRSGGPAGEHYAFDCCGTNSYPPELLSLSAAEGKPVIRLHGLLSDDEYRSLLAETAVALALQKGQGRHANLKSPSKAYEFLAAGKLVITTDVGDLASHSGDHLIMLQQESAEELVRIFGEIAENPQKYEKIALAARNFSRRESSYEAVGKKLTAFLAQAFSNSELRPHGLEGT